MRVLTCAAALAVLGASAHAEINVVDSIEWMTVDSDVVVRGTVTAAFKRPGGADGWYDATVKVGEALKGNAAVEIHVGIGGYLPVDRWRASRADLVLFLNATKNPTESKAIDSLPFQLRNSRHSEPAIELGTAKAYTSAFAVLSTPAEITGAIRASRAAVAVNAHRLDVTPDSDAYKVLWGGSAVWMWVPVDAGLERRAIAWLADKSSWRRLEGLGALANFRSDANIARVKPLLADPETANVGDGATMHRRFLVRAKAHEVLTSWGVTHATPVLDQP
jgi:hypothetical protein